MSGYILIGHPGGGMSWHENVSEDFQEPGHKNIERFESKGSLIERVGGIQNKLPDNVDLPNEIGQ